MPAATTSQYGDSRARHSKGICNEIHELPIRLAVNRGGLEPNLESFAMQATEFILPGICLNMAAQHQRWALPVKVLHIASSRLLGKPVATAAWLSRIVKTLISMKTSIGDRSSPPIGGNSLRTGAITGSLI